MNGTVAEAALFEDEAPRAVEALLGRFPIDDRAIQTRSSATPGARRTTTELLPEDAEVEDVRSDWSPATSSTTRARRSA